MIQCQKKFIFVFFFNFDKNFKILTFVFWKDARKNSLPQFFVTCPCRHRQKLQLIFDVLMYESVCKNRASTWILYYTCSKIRMVQWKYGKWKTSSHIKLWFCKFYMLNTEDNQLMHKFVKSNSRKIFTWKIILKNHL